MYKYFMKKSNLILTLFISSLFISTSLDAAVFDSNILKNNQKRDLLIASPGGHGGGGGGGGGKKPKDKKEECIKRSKRAIGFFERQLFDEERLGKSTEKWEKKIKEYKQLLSKCEDIKTPAKKERQKEAQEIRNRQKVIKEKRYLKRWADLRGYFLREKNKINNEPIGDGDFFKLLDEKMAKLRLIDIALNLIDECNVYRIMDTSTEKEVDPPESLKKAYSKFMSEYPKIDIYDTRLFSEGFSGQVMNLRMLAGFTVFINYWKPKN